MDHNEWHFAVPKGWPPGFHAEQAHGLITTLPNGNLIERRTWLAGPLAVVGADDRGLAVVNALAPWRTIAIPRESCITVIRLLLDRIGVRTTICRHASRNLQNFLRTVRPGSNAWNQQHNQELAA